MTNLQKLNKELIKYFTARKWKNRIVFRFENGEVLLCSSYFSESDNSNKKSIWYVADCPSLQKYTCWFFEHVRPFWVEYNMGECKLNVEHNIKNYIIKVSASGYVTEFTFPPEIHNP